MIVYVDLLVSFNRGEDDMHKKNIYRIRFMNQGNIYELYAKNVAEAEMFGFVEIENLIFGESTSLVVDPLEERMKTEFNGVKCTYIPISSILRIDVVEKEGVAKVVNVSHEATSNVSPFPLSLYNTPGLSKPIKS